MDKVIELAHELKDEIESTSLVQEYRRMLNLVESDEELKELKTQIVLAKGTDKHKELLSRYNNHPLVVNLRTLEEEVKDYLKEITNIINKK